MLRGLSADERARLHDLVVVFLHEKTIEGCGGLSVTELMRRQIAAQACLLVLELGIDAYSHFDTVLVYPREFRTRHSFEDEHGLVHVDDGTMLGEAWPGGPVILSWEDARPLDDVDPLDDDGFNLVAHEFAHKLDMLTGAEDGVPPLHSGIDASAWRRDFDAAMDDLDARCARGDEPAIDPYAAESEAECFAVFSEVFFQAPDLLLSEYPAVYGHLKAFYRQDPIARPERTR
jgi:hypothetical protein